MYKNYHSEEAQLKYLPQKTPEWPTKQHQQYVLHNKKRTLNSTASSLKVFIPAVNTESIHISTLFLPPFLVLFLFLSLWWLWSHQNFEHSAHTCTCMVSTYQYIDSLKQATMRAVSTQYFLPDSVMECECTAT